MLVKFIAWDVDKVWYPDISTTYASKGSKAEPMPFVEQGLRNGWYTDSDLAGWAAFKGYERWQDGIQSVYDVAQMYTDFFKSLKKDSGESLFSKAETIERKQGLLKGITLGEIYNIAKGVELTEGLKDTITEFDLMKIQQAAFSDGLAPFVNYFTINKGMLAFVTPTRIEIEEYGRTREEMFNDAMIYMNHDYRLTGKTLPFDKADEFGKYIKNGGIGLNEVAAIDDSAANISRILLPVKQAGGLAVGFCPTDVDRPKFEQAEIPIITERNLLTFVYTVKFHK